MSMTADRTEKTSDELRELARIVVRDRIDAAHFAAYMQGLLANHLIELDATCRCEAMKLCQHCSDLSDLELAGHLYETAAAIERGGSSSGRSLNRVCGQLAYGKSRQQLLELAQGQRRSFQASRKRVSWFPEIIAAVAFLTVGVFLLRPNEYGDLTLRLIASGVCGLVGIANAVVAIHAAWQNAHAAT
jgi:hypothetical protein